MAFELDGLNYDIQFKDQGNDTYVISIVAKSPCSDDIVYSECLDNYKGTINDIKKAVKNRRIKLAHKTDSGRPEIECEYGSKKSFRVIHTSNALDNDLDKLIKQHKAYHALLRQKN